MSTEHPSDATVASFYDFMKEVFPLSGCPDMTEGIYDGDPSTPYEIAQDNQLNFLLTELGCSGERAQLYRLFEVGSGHGSLMERAIARGATVTGITISPAQVRYCREEKGLHVLLQNYRNLDDGWNGTQDGVAANGPVEHFVQPQDVKEGRADELYREFFAICHRIIDRQSASRRLVTTVIHYDNYRPTPDVLLSNPFSHRIGSDNFHAAYLGAVMGGSYPEQGQLERCAEGYYKPVKVVDGTQDYEWTSEEWLRRARRTVLHPLKGPTILVRLLPKMVRHPKHCLQFLGLLLSESWQWQFRGKNPPTKLLRHTWEYRE